MEPHLTSVSLGNRLLVALALLLVGAVVRLVGIQSVDPHPDELHWKSRSNEIIERLRRDELTRATTHIGHPGVSAALVMATGIVLAEKYNDVRGLSPEDGRFVRMPDGARMAVAVFSAVLPPVLWLLLLPLIGSWAAVLAALLVVFDPLSTGFARMAHLDSVLAVLASISILLLYFAESSRRVQWSLAAGAVWGLAIATKPTAVAIIPAVVLFRALWHWCGRMQKDEPCRLLYWSDVWAVIVGHVVFASLFTRLWFHESDYLRRLNIQSALADGVYAVGLYLHQQPIIPVLVGLGLLFLLLRFPRYAATVGVALILFSSLAVFPQVLENLIRFWIWVFGLSGERHVAYGFERAPPQFGYLEILMTQLPEVALLGVLLAAVALFSRRVRQSDGRLLLFLALVVLVWVLLLSVSSKQTFRYVLPLVPALYVISAIGWTRCCSSNLLRAWSVVVLVLVQASVVWSWCPMQGAYANWISGGLHAAVSRGRPLPPMGQREALSFLQSQANAAGRVQFVSLLADNQVYRYMQKQLASSQPETSPQLLLRPQKSYYASDYLLVDSSFRARFAAVLAELEPHRSLAYQFLVRGVPVTEVYKVSATSHREPRALNLREAAQRAGKKLRQEDRSTYIAAHAGKHRKGFALFDIFLRVQPGAYVARYALAFPDIRSEKERALPAERYVARIDVGSACSKILTHGDLLELAKHPNELFEIECSFEEATRVQFKIYWFGNISFELRSLVFQRVIKG